MLPAALVLSAMCFSGGPLAASIAPFQDQKDEHPLEHLKSEQRLQAIRHAQVWMPTEVAKMDLKRGPEGRGTFAPNETVACDYVEKKPGGSSPKFDCSLGPDDIVKVKYGRDNVEVYASVAASRLLWALGFGADRWYPVKVLCRGCPADPHHEQRRAEGTMTFTWAALERPMPGKTMETKPDEGWSWRELDLVDETVGGAPKAQRDAFKLLAAMIQHTDSKEQQQRLICLPGAAATDAGAPGCAAPFMFIHDVGLTFGGANFLNKNTSSGANIMEWQKRPVWEKPEKCQAKLTKSFTGTLDDPIISEAGRKFLADLLVQLSDAQLRDLFEVARFPDYSHISADDWVATFKKKRDEITSITCGG